MSTFSTPATDAIQRTISVDQRTATKSYSPSELDEYFDISPTASQITKNDYKRVALQFPDDLLHVSVPVFRSLKSKVGDGRELYVLADTSYGSCCVDEVAAQHVDADAVIHYGHACMSQTSRLPVVYVFGKDDLDVEDCASRLVEVFLEDRSHEENQQSTVVFRCDVAYSHAAERVVEHLRGALQAHNATISYTAPQCCVPSTSPSLPSSRSLEPAPRSEAHPSSPIIFYLGPESITLTNLLMTNPTTQIYAYSPLTKTARPESSLTNKLLMKRYAVIQKARDADVFGILVGTLGVSSYLPLITHLRQMLSKTKKKFYTVSVGKLNPAKLANFLEIECWVLVACPEGSLVGNSKDFLKPIVTPYELQLALAREGQGWTGNYILDFQEVMQEPGASVGDDDARGSDDEDQPQFSLVTGKYRHAKRYGEDARETAGNEVQEDGAVVLRNQNTSLTSNGTYGSYLQTQRTYKGLEARVGKDQPSILEQGRSGIASTYGEIESVDRAPNSSI